jgi:hypothetical protein
VKDCMNSYADMRATNEGLTVLLKPHWMRVAPREKPHVTYIPRSVS